MNEKAKKEVEEAEEWARSLEPGGQTKRGREHLRAKQEAAKQEAAKRAAGKKKAISIRLDEDVLELVKEMAGEGSYQRLINQALREWVNGRRLEEVVRRVIREEFEAQETQKNSA